MYKKDIKLDINDKYIKYHQPEGASTSNQSQSQQSISNKNYCCQIRGWGQINDLLCQMIEQMSK